MSQEVSNPLNSLSKKEQVELAISILSDIANIAVTEEEHYELINLVWGALNKETSAVALLEFLLGTDALQKYLNEEIEKLEEYLKEQEDENQEQLLAKNKQ